MKRADFALLNGKIWTGDGDGFTEAFAARGGRTVAAGTTVEIRELCDKSTEVVDAEGHLVLPGMTDSHVHFLMGGFSLLQANLNGVASREKFIEIVAGKDAELPGGMWLRGGGWENTRWSPPVLPDVSWFDSISPGRPVYLTKQDMHSAVVNRTALELAGITKETPDPDGGRIIRDPETGEPTGFLWDSAMQLVERVLPQYDETMRRQAVSAACAEARKLGVTCVHDMSLFDEVGLYASMANEDDFTLRFRTVPPIRRWREVLDMQREYGRDERLSEKFRISGVKAFVDGSIGSSTALFYDNYIDGSGDRGLYNDIMFPEGNLLNIAAEADAAGLQLVIHAIGDRANRELLDIYEKILERNGGRDRRWRIEHAQHVPAEDVARYKRLGVTASMQPYQCIDDARFMEKRLGVERSKRAFSFNTFLKAGIPMVFGSDWTVAPLDPLTGIDAAVNRIPLGDTESWYPEEAIPLKEALRAYTVNPTHVFFEDGERGTISPGKFADCVVLSRDIFADGGKSIRDTSVEMTIFGGKVVYRK